ncbi:MAG: hypothetical protein COA94_04765 [Rickettsiales bacterium]|nr:MAG: hypothetical protein COA94_04765 [Rickettsiales bacterium]
MKDDIRKITITITDLDFTNPKVEVEGEFNGAQSRRALAAGGKYIRVRATRAHYERQYAEEAAAQAKEDAKTVAKQKAKEAADILTEERLANEIEEQKADTIIDSSDGVGWEDTDEEDDDHLLNTHDTDNGVLNEDK